MQKANGIIIISNRLDFDVQLMTLTFFYSRKWNKDVTCYNDGHCAKLQFATSGCQGAKILSNA